MALRLAFPNVTEPREPGDESLLQRKASAERNDGFSARKLRDGTVEAQNLHSQKVAGVLAPDSVLQEIVEHARLATGATGAFIGHVRDHEIVCQATGGSNAGKFVAYLNGDHRIVDSFLRAATLQYCPDSDASEELDRTTCRYLGARSIIVIPIMDEKKEKVWIFGVFSSQTGAFSSGHVVALQNLARHIAEAIAHADRGTPVSLAEASALPRPDPRKLALIRGQLRPRRDSLAAIVRRSPIWISGILAISLLGSWMLGRALNQRATQTWAKGPSAATSETVYASSPRRLLGQDSTNSVQSYRFAGSVKPATQVPTAHETKTKPNPIQQKLPDLEIENALDDASSDSLVITKSSDEPTTEAMRGQAGAPAADMLSASAVSIPETVALDHLVERMQPDYPEDAKAQHVQGTVMLDVVVGRDGQVESVSVVEGNARLLASAAEAVGKWRFTPLIRNGQSVKFKSHIALHFDLP